MSMRKTFVITCNRKACLNQFHGMRPAATAAGWTCDTPRGLDFCPNPECKAVAPKLKPRGTCAFCSKRLSLRKAGEPTQHKFEGIRCPGSYMVAKP